MSAPSGSSIRRPPPSSTSETPDSSAHPTISPAITEPPPPAGPPPLLTSAQILQLSHTGSLPLSLPPHLATLYAQLSQTVSSDFFLSKTLPEKRALYPSSHGGEVGYVSIPGEKEYVTFRNTSSRSDSELEQLLRQTWRETCKLLFRVLVDLTRPLDSHELWQPLIESAFDVPASFDSDTTTFVRLFRYLPTEGAADTHTDSGLLTLCVGIGEGLQVLAPSERLGQDDGISNDHEEEQQQVQWKWHPALHPTILVGDTLHHLLDGRVRPGVHRVVGNPHGRSSAVFALRANLGVEIDLSDGEGKADIEGNPDIVEDGGKETSVLKIRDLWTEITSRKWSVNASKQERERKRAELRRKGEGCGQRGQQQEEQEQVKG